MDDFNINWIRSSRCGPNAGNCVELSRAVGSVRIRDSKCDTVALLEFDHDTWSVFVQTCRSAF